MFLSKDELKTVALTEVINIITESDDTIVAQIIAESIDLMKSYLHNYYNINAIFDAAGNDRSLIVLKYLKDIVIHEIYIRRTHEYNEAAKIRYDEALLWLEKVAKGEINPPLPQGEDTDGDGKSDTDTSYLNLGSRPKYKTGW